MSSLTRRNRWRPRRVTVRAQPSYPSIDPILDYEHAEIFKAFDNLYSACANHWRTENAMYRQGISLMPPGHAPVADEWSSHESEHSALLEQIKAMKEQVRNHIVTQDVKHFSHWAGLR